MKKKTIIIALIALLVLTMIAVGFSSAADTNGNTKNGSSVKVESIFTASKLTWK